jgi:branched-chain amino acid transport system permease protein
MNPSQLRLLKLAGLVAIPIVAYVIPFTNPDSMLRDLTTVMTYALPALGLAVLTGFSGQISVGQGAFMAIGAYTTAILVADGAAPWFVAIAASVVLAGLAGAIVGLPALRIRGPALALTTLGLAVLMPKIIERYPDVTGGSQGKRLFQYRFRSPVDSLTDEQWIYIVVVTFVMVAFLLTRNLVRSRVGRGLITIRDNEVAAEVLGVNIAIYKITGFAVSGMLAGLGGALAVVAQPSVAPGDYGIQLSIRLLVMAVVGGIATIAGPIIGAAAVYFLDDWIKTSDALNDLLSDNGPELAPVVFGAALILLMAVMPDGLMGGLHRGWARFVTARRAPPAGARGDPSSPDLSSRPAAATPPS